MGFDFSSGRLGVVRDGLDENVSSQPGMVWTRNDGSMEVSLLFPGDALVDAFGRLGDFDEHDRIFTVQTDDERLVLYGCQMTQKKLKDGMGFKTYRVGFAVAGPSQLELDGAAGCTRAEISGLFAWVGEHAIESIFEKDGQSALAPSYYRVIEPSPSWSLVVDEISRYSVKTEAYSINSHSGLARGPMVTLKSRALIKQDVKEPVHWKDSFENIRRMRDLLTIASGVPQEVLSIDVSFDLFKDFKDDRPRAWSPIVALDLIGEEPDAHRNNWLFRFRDIGEEGMSKWQSFSSERRLRRGYYALVSAIRGNRTNEEKLTLCAIAIDAIGQFLAIQNGEQKEDAKRSKGLDFTAEQVYGFVSPVLGKASDPKWSKKFSDCTNLMKHSEKDYVPEPFEELMVVDKAIFYLRVSLPLLLGCNMETLTKSVRLDSQNPSQFKYAQRIDPKDLKSEIAAMKRKAAKK